MNLKNKRKAKNTISYLSAIMEDSRITVWHLAILVAVLQLGNQQGQFKIIKVSRSRIMKLSHVKTLPTYYKYFKELQNFGYLTYRPSYHPGFKSEVEIH
ncbi:hypothetical protein NLG42_21280 [Flavobacterium plurextorum]|uniref:hypothetical protein n=1 Tax=Flavobacterium TaxID=237 RepID=UPI00214D1667|nr:MULTISPECIES: hypothetical protein [Flavobacterium]UUW08624.1 hypothetical protein NLG42_21280 [Flavobacterium plurextorum]